MIEALIACRLKGAVLLSEDQRLMRCIGGGDKESLHRIYEKYVDDLLAVGICLLSDVHAAEDCLHDVFVAFAESVSSLRIRSSLKGYLVSCVANLARDQLRKKSRQSVRELDEQDHAAKSGDPARQLVDFEESGRIFEAIRRLPYEQREVFVLHIQGELKFREIAELVGISVNTAQSRYRYGVEKLRALLSKGNDHEV